MVVVPVVALLELTTAVGVAKIFWVLLIRDCCACCMPNGFAVRPEFEMRVSMPWCQMSVVM